MADKVLKWLVESGFKVEKLTEVQTLRAKWGYRVTTPPPIPTTIAIFEPQDYSDRLLLLLGINIAPEHRMGILRMDRSKRLSFMSRVILDILRICPTCRVGVQPSMIEPQSIVATLILFYENLTKSSLVNSLVMLSNVYTSVLANFWSEFPTGRETYMTM